MKRSAPCSLLLGLCFSVATMTPTAAPGPAQQAKQWNDIRAAAQKAAKTAIDAEIVSGAGDGSQGLDKFRKLMLEACRGLRYQITDPKVRAGVEAECAYWTQLPKATRPIHAPRLRRPDRSPSTLIASG